MIDNYDIKVSVIVPVHNAGKRLKKCMDSIIHQTLREIEIIAVLDCPTDGSDKIIHEYAKADDRIKVIENDKNIHIGESRNKGIEIARGEYIHFSDHDDYRELDMLEIMYKMAKEHELDMLISTPVSVENGEITIYNKEKECRNRDYILKHLIRGGYEDDKHPWSYYCNVHNILYLRKIIDRNAIKFVDTKEKTPEDYIFNLECLIYANKVEEIKRIFYYHNLLSESEGHKISYFSGIKRIRGYIYIYEILTKEEIFNTYKDDFYSNVSKNFVLLLFRAIECNKSIKEFFKCITYYRKIDFTKEAFKYYKSFLEKEYRGAKYLILRIIVFMILFARK